MPYGFSFSWKRAIGLSAAKGRLSRQIGRAAHAKWTRAQGRPVINWLGAGMVILALLILAHL